MNNKYFILRHGETCHQVEKPGILYYWPEDKPPAYLTTKGQNQIKEAAKKLKDKKIDLIFASDVLRTRQTADIVAKKLGIEVIYDERLRDINVGIFQGEHKTKFWSTLEDMKQRIKKSPPKGESWTDTQNRTVDFIKEIDRKYQGKNILIISHGDPLWLLESWLRGLNDEELLKEKRNRSTIKTGELRQLT